jgi:uncharacterized protein (TIGR02246 family)
MRTVAIVSMTLFSAMAPARDASQAARSQGAVTVQAGIQQVADAYVKANLAGDANAVAALYTDDAVEMPPNQPMIKGRAAIQQYYEKLFGGGVKMTAFTLTHLETRGTGDSGYDVGTYQQNMSQPSPAPPASDSGKYIVILRQSGGAWKVAYAIYNSDQAPMTGR